VRLNFFDAVKKINRSTALVFGIVIAVKKKILLTLRFAEKDLNSGGVASSSGARWANWAVSGMTSLTSKIYKGNRETSQPRPAKTAPASTNAAKGGIAEMFVRLLM